MIATVWRSIQGVAVITYIHSTRRSSLPAPYWFLNVIWITWPQLSHCPEHGSSQGFIIFPRQHVAMQGQTSVAFPVWNLLMSGKALQSDAELTAKFSRACSLHFRAMAMAIWASSYTLWIYFVGSNLFVRHCYTLSFNAIRFRSQI